MAAILRKHGSITSSWQQTVYLASQYIIGLDEQQSLNTESEDEIELFGPLDNSSHQCPSWYNNEGGYCVPCLDDKPLWWLVLRWFKMMLLKIARSYHAKPLLLAVAPLMVGLMVGLLVGYCIGRIQTGSRKPIPNSIPRPQDVRLSSIPGSGWISWICSWLVKLMTIVLGSYATKRWNRKSNGLLRKSDKVSFALEPLPSSACSHDDDMHITKSQSDDASRTRKETSSLEVITSEPAIQSCEERVRSELKSESGCRKESGVDTSLVPKHVAVIMDGNRRYGKSRYGNASRGHWDGSSKLVEFAKWCIAEEVSVLTVFAFSTENWNRDPSEVASLMAIFAKYCDELRVEALKRNIKILILSTDTSRVSNFSPPCHLRLPHPSLSFLYRFRLMFKRGLHEWWKRPHLVKEV